MKLITLFVAFLSATLALSAQTISPPKKLPAIRVSSAPKIDGTLDEELWKGVAAAGDFFQFRPSPGPKEPNHRRTEVKIVYDDVAIYLAARMYDHPDSVVKELVTRDQIGNADFVGVIFDTFHDGINGYGFYVTAAGVQFDAKYSQTGNEDPAWNAVWESAVVRDAQGWTAEFKIPYSALRFASTAVQNWGLNITRKRTGFNQQYMWNFIDPKVNGFINQSGVLEGLKDIKPPIRLSFSPYISSYINHYPNSVPGVKSTTASFNGGMDVKYGINKSFTLDVTLIPDFGQVQSDNRILNLTPFEVRYDERRQFFTEGTELFNKGDLFYSRRIGNDPGYYKDISGQLKPGETVVDFPLQSKLINASKLSGRTASGLGIGFFNAVTNRMFSEVEDLQGNRRRIESQPLTNYNVFVLDQSLKNSGSVSFVNTNVLRQGHDYDANVSAFMFNLRNKKQIYAVSGSGRMSHLSGPSGGTGFNGAVSIEKQSGNFTWEYEAELADTKFDPSDMGFFTNNNYFDQSLGFAYQVYKPSKWYNELQSWIEMEYSRKYKTGAYQGFGIYPGIYAQFKNFWSVELNAFWQAEGNDFYEARNGQVFKTPESYRIALFVNPNRAKAYNFGGNVNMIRRSLLNGVSYNFYFFQNLRLSDKVALGLDLNYQPSYNQVNWVGFNGAQSVFSKYHRHTVENSFDAKYSFNNKMGIVARARHYWSDRRNKDFFGLNAQGELDPYAGPALQNTDRTYNVFNVDFIYTWVFAPGSELSVAYKNAAETNERSYRKRYFKNFDNVFSSPQNNSLSVKLLYFIDFLDLKKRG